MKFQGGIQLHIGETTPLSKASLTEHGIFKEILLLKIEINVKEVPGD